MSPHSIFFASQDKPHMWWPHWEETAKLRCGGAISHHWRFVLRVDLHTRVYWREAANSPLGKRGSVDVGSKLVLNLSDTPFQPKWALCSQRFTWSQGFSFTRPNTSTAVWPACEQGWECILQCAPLMGWRLVWVISFSLRAVLNRNIF